MIFDRVIEILDNKEKYEFLREEIKKGMSKFYIKKYNKKPSEIAYKEIILSLFSHYQS